jgi:hypothetical protein
MEKNVHFENKKKGKSTYTVGTCYLAICGTVKTPKLQWWLLFRKQKKLLL